MSEANDLLMGTTPDEVKRDRWGRYLLEDPTTGQTTGWTRATSLVKVLSDTKGLEGWQQRNLVFGMGQRPDLYARAASIASTEERDDLSTIVKEALDAAAGGASANFGTAIHRFTERIDRGESPVVPDEWAPDVNAYVQAMAQAGIGVLEVEEGQMIERITIAPQIKVAGTADRILTGPWELPRIGDLKTGKDLKYSMGEIAAQLAIYAHATHWWDAKAKTYHKMPEVDQHTAIVMHVPIGKGTCELIEVDIAAGWKAVLLAVAIKAWRARNDLGVSYDAVRAIESIVEHKETVDTAKAEAKEQKAVEKKAASPFPCEHCDKGYKTKGGLKKHVEEVHTAEEVSAHESAERSVDTETGEIIEPTVDEAVDMVTEAFGDVEVVDKERASLEERLLWIKARVKNIVNEGHADELAEVWNYNSPNVPTFGKGGPTTHEEIDLLGRTCNLVETANGMAFFDVDPARQSTTKPFIKDLLAS